MTETRTDDVLIALRRIMRATELNSRGLAKKSNLTPSQLIVLQLIANGRRVTPGYIADKSTLSHATVTALLQKLESRGLISRQKDDTDKRRQHIMVTELGITTISTAPDILQTQFQKQFGEIDEWEQNFLLSALQRVASMLDADQIDAAPILHYGEINIAGSETE
jgi:DNA-binding MarR family transcriptional regulator